MTAVTVRVTVPQQRLAPALADALLYVLRQEQTEGQPPTRAAADAAGYAAAVAALEERRLLRPAPRGLSRLELTLAGRSTARTYDGATR